jgi:hypothetical protein
MVIVLHVNASFIFFKAQKRLGQKVYISKKESLTLWCFQPGLSGRTLPCGWTCQAFCLKEQSNTAAEGSPLSRNHAIWLGQIFFK